MRGFPIYYDAPMDPNSHEALVRRRDGATGIVAAIFALRSSPTPWHDAHSCRHLCSWLAGVWNPYTAVLLGTTAIAGWCPASRFLAARPVWQS